MGSPKSGYEAVTMKKWFFRCLGLLLLGAAIWYVFLKEYDYKVSFTTSEPTGIVFHHLLDWNSFDTSEQAINIISRSPFYNIKQQITSGDSIFHYNWFIEPTGTSRTKVTAYITDEKNSLKQKVLVPFGKNNFVKRSIGNVKLAGDALLQKSKEYKVHGIKDTLISPLFCAYVPVASKVNEKASAMLQNIAVVMDYINLNGLKLQGDPFLEVTEWNWENDSIKFNFCFPIKKTDSLPVDPNVLLKTTTEQRVLKAEFNGNYRISSKAWYYLQDYADRNHIEVDMFPIEYFLNDPHEGGNPLEWKALIFLPLKE